jgi:daunorubicin resistance ABC transporter ATP-binding subunit
MTHAIEADALQKTFKGKREVRALDGVNFAVEEGTVFGLLGPNGSGKTTAVRILTTILKPDGGSARVLGHDVTKEPGVVRSLIGLAGQYAAVDENLTGRENLVMVGRLNHLPGSYVSGRANELLAEFDLTDAGDRPLKTYSGGMRRRLDLAAALVARPTVLFLDEPTTGLDPQSRNDLWEVIEGLVGGGTTVLLTTQYLEEADRLANTLSVIDHGRVIAGGSPAQLKAELGTTVLEVGLHDHNDAGRAATVLASLGSHAPNLNGNQVEVTVENGPEAAMTALRTFDQEGIMPTAFALREPSLDDVFLALTGRRAEEDGDGDPEGEPAGGTRRGRRGGNARPPDRSPSSPRAPTDHERRDPR